MKIIITVNSIALLLLVGCNGNKTNNASEEINSDTIELEKETVKNDSISNELDNRTMRIESASDSLENLLNELN